MSDIPQQNQLRWCKTFDAARRLPYALGMATDKKSAPHPAIKDIMFSGEDICIIFKDSSRLVVSLEKFPALRAAELQDRCDCTPADKGTAIVWGKLGIKITLDELLAEN